MSDRWVSFDCYGTLVDWRSGMERALASVAAPSAASALFVGYHRHEATLQSSDPFMNYRDVLTEGVRAAASEEGVPLDEASMSILADSLPTWPVFAETARVLRSLKKAGWRLAILSNVDDEMIAQTLPQLGARIDEVVTSEQVGSYKPALGHFETLRQRTGTGPGSWIHVACSWFHDVTPAHELGVDSIFVNRERENRETSLAAAVIPNLIDLESTLRRTLP